MHPIESLVPSILLLITLSLLMPSSSSEIYYRYTSCAPYVYICGTAKLNINYPFRVDGRPDYCGHPGYYIACSKDNASMTISINNKGYQVKAVDYLNHLITVVDQRFVAQPCPRPYENTSIDYSLYTCSDRDRNATLYIDCRALPASLLAGVYEISCAFNGTTRRRWYYQLSQGIHSNLMGRCNSTVMVPMHQTTANDLANKKLNFGEAVKEGFSVSWTAGNGWCSDCTNSGGRCGYDSLSPTSHACHCQNGAAITKCYKGTFVDT
ncbi:LEAF RUST 10 DISEASE-RESISTANCE LOCUS RECEPTOR-LIKE PROTEIN KINASE-like [Canna indica]|uniref:LEAF RUST 10 DISEASE-RESISTANCE LOCUS RECEPTOR-LIKE PROTEIN KINASE-like n=1 Tax=Canna indica TaxID=4628 RepID=A0AAQ3JP11_9LILI|nr:LEAF RUST 10 DISEASE-RESISTANCE LOCUS RECEPTOR-LIKE PROTEIN KINASE-like [Canna indica]